MAAFDWDKTHLCLGSKGNGKCKYFLEPQENFFLNGKTLDKYHYYCLSEDKTRKIGKAGLWTGLSPKFCPKRKAMEQGKEKNQ